MQELRFELDAGCWVCKLINGLLGGMLDLARL